MNSCGELISIIQDVVRLVHCRELQVVTVGVLDLISELLILGYLLNKP